MAWKGDERLLLADDEDVLLARDELLAFSVNQLDHSVRTIELGDGLDLTDTTGVLSSCDLGQSVVFKLGNLHDFSGLDVELDGVACHDGDVQETDVAAVVGVAVEDPLLSCRDCLDLEQFESSLFGVDRDKLEAPFGVVHDTVVLVGFGDSENVHESGWVPLVSPWLAIDNDVLLADDHASLAHVAGEVQAVANDQGQWKALSDFVRTLGRPGSVDAAHLVEHPVVGRI